MSQPGWRSSTPLADWLAAEAFRFDFFQAVRILERRRPDAVPVGEGSDPAREAVRFASTIRLDFPPSDVEALKPAKSPDAPDTLQVNFFGIAGGEGPLPAPYVEFLIDRLRDHDYAARDFLDIFNHRLLSVMARAAKAHRPALTPSSPEASAAGQFLHAFAGLGPAALRGRLSIPDAALLRYAGLLWQQPHSAAGLERILSDYFRLPMTVRPLQGRWRQIPASDRTALGRRGANRALGRDAALGSRVWDQAAGIEVESGPLTLPQFLRLLPGGEDLPALRDLTRLYSGTLHAVSVYLVLRADAAPDARLGAARLGCTAWLPTARARVQSGRIRFRAI